MDKTDVRVGIVILNYEKYSDTINCVRSIDRKNIKYEHIVVVDNCSNNDSFFKLKKEFEDNEKISVIQTSYNGGFAKGNNQGILYLKRRNIDYILLLNNDTIIIEEDYLEKMLKEYKSGVGVIGSKIKLLHGIEQEGEWEDLSLKYSLFLLIKEFAYVHYLYFPFKYNKCAEKNLRLHGATILLTPDFFKFYDMFWPYTFLYREEMILSIMLEKVGLKLEIADTYIFHREGQTTGDYWKNNSRKRRKMEFSGICQQAIVNILPYKVINLLIKRKANAK